MRNKKHFWFQTFLSFIILGLTICSLCHGSGVGENRNDEISSARKKLSEVVKEAKEGDMRQMSLILQFLGKGYKEYVSEELLTDYISFLNDENGQVQRIGATGLSKIKGPKATKTLFEYLKNKDLRKLDKNIEKGDIDFYQTAGEVYASVTAIGMLGISGDESVISLLESFRGIKCLQLEGYYPVEEALAHLGAVKSLTNIPPDADEMKIRGAASAVRKIKDPNKVPELIATVRNPKIADAIRYSAIDALGEIGKNNSHSPVIANFLVDIVSDSGYDHFSRMYAAITAGKTKAPTVENLLLTNAQDPNSDIRQYALKGLIYFKPEKYLDRCFEIIMDPNEDLEFRKSVEGIIPNSILSLIDKRAKIFECLNASDKDGKPINKIRVDMWCLINDLYGEEPSLTLTTRDSRVTEPIRSVIELKMMRKNYRLRFPERQKMVEGEIQRIVNIYSE